MPFCGVKLTHDGGLALVDEGRLVFAVEMEKLGNRARHSRVEDLEVVDRLLEEEGLGLADVALSFDGWRKISKVKPWGGQETTIELAPYRRWLGNPDPLRAHRDDLPVLMDILLARINRDRQPPLRLSTACRQRLLGHDFPGNIRELVNIFERLAVLADDVAEEQHLPPELLGQAAPAGEEEPLPFASADEPLKAQVQRFERQVILQAVRLCGSKRKAAQHLGIDVGTLIRKLQRD